ncbi:F-box domain containing protein [Trema orientale]|uniref:F-box domain containing protein n=1 Tax=Trema orientale TaxID=63057 RepID=A0A2P5F0N0_TREOI|nr:F-box domain containing protein [Trema orientale]
MTTMASLPWVAIVNILSRLPVKDLLRYRCVSKPWCSLIDGPDFIKMHLNHSTETSSNLGLIRAGRQLHWVGLDTPSKAVRLKPPINKARGMQILGRSNGLVALVNSEGEMALGNPSTRKYMKVPLSDLREDPGNFEFGMLGFGYDPVNDDHKFLRMIHYFTRDSSSFHSEVKVYSLKSKTWKRVADYPYYGVHHGSGVLVCNSLHWIMALRFPDSTLAYLVVAFDLVTEEYRQILLRDKKSKQINIFNTTLTEFGGWLCELTKVTKGDRVDHVDIWVMKEYGVRESWTKLFSVVPSDVTGIFKSATLLAYLKSAHQALFDLDGEKLMVYDLETKKAKSVMKIPECPKCLHTVISVGSLVGLGGLGGDDGDTNSKKAGENGDDREKQKLQLSRQKR